jgi:hypothetical protein
MHVSTYCGFILVVATLGFATPTKSSNGCGYDVREFDDMITNYIKYDVDSRHAL